MTRQLTVTLETVTPMFLAGADNSTPELRPPPFRGMMRYWFRALAGGVAGEENLRAKETKVWGSASQGSPILVRIRPPAKLLRSEFTSHSPPGLKRGESSGHDYLYWSMKGFGKQKPRPKIDPGQKFGLTLATRPGSHANSEIFWQAAASLWLLIQFGGLGSRSRRTAGSLRCLNISEIVNQISLPEFIITATTPHELASMLDQGIARLRDGFKSLYGAEGHPTSAFSTLHPQHSKVWVVAPTVEWIDWLSAVDGIGSAMRDFRNRRAPDYQNVRDWMHQGVTPPTVERSAFGLPLPFRYNSQPKVKGFIQGTKKIERRASPLHLHISRLSNERYVGVFTLFKAELLPQEAQLKNNNRKARHPAPPPTNFDLIEEFVTSSFDQVLEVQL